MAIQCARLLDELKAEEIIVLDLRKLSDIADFFVIATARTRRQVQATARKLKTEGKALTGRPPGLEGHEDALWVLVDFFDVVVHLFQPEPRAHYDLEMLWGDAPKTRWKAAAPKPQD